MSTSPTDAAAQPLTFDAAVPTQGEPATDAAPCAQCGAAIDEQYFTIEGAIVCPSCRQSMEQGRERGTSAGRFTRAALFGFGGAIVGAALYFTVVAVTGYEIGLIAIAVGWLVGLGVSRGSRGRGGRRYQVLAVLLAYLAIDATYLGYLVKESIGKGATSADSTAVAADTVAANAAAGAPRDALAPATDSAASNAQPAATNVSALMVIGFIVGLPIIANLGSMPGGLIGLLIIFFALSQAWRMNAATKLVFEGPFRMGARGPDDAVAPAGA